MDVERVAGMFAQEPPPDFDVPGRRARACVRRVRIGVQKNSGHRGREPPISTVSVPRLPRQYRP